MTFAVIPAAGSSVRMGQPKLLLPLGPRSVLGHVVAAFRSADVDRIVVVTSPLLPQIAEDARCLAVNALVLPQPTKDMRSTIEYGWRWVEENWRPGSSDLCFITPADHPTTEPMVIRQLLEASRRRSKDAIFVPTFAGKRGHPLLLRWDQCLAIRKFQPDAGINQYLRQNGVRVVEVPAATGAILDDLDTPDDYQRLRRKFERSNKGESGTSDTGP